MFGNVGSIISFRIGGEDSKVIASEFNPRFKERDLINLGVRDFCVKMSIDGETQEAFSGRTLEMKVPEQNFANECVAFSRKHYARPLADVKDILSRWEEGEIPQTNGRPAGNAPQKKTSSRFDDPVEFEEPII